MKSFKYYIKEDTDMAIELDQTFMKRAASVTSFNLTANDFTSLKYKKEIQTLYSQYMFPSFDPSMAMKKMDIARYNYLIYMLKRDSKEQYEKLHNLPLRGVGPGEAAMFLLIKDAHLGGGSSAGVDLVVGSKKYEIKAAKWRFKSSKDSVYDFKLGGNITGMTKVISDLQELAYELKLVSEKNASTIPGSVINQIEKADPKRFDLILKQYQKLASSYFGDHETIFIQTESNQKDFGEILAIKKVKPEDITIERYTSNVIKPVVKIK